MPDLFTSPHACRCESCCPDDPAPTYTRQWLIACLAREIAALPDGRADAVRRLGEKRGADYLEALADAVRSELKKRKEGGNAS